MADISIPVDDTVKQEAEMICEELGMDLSIATNLFYKKLISYGGIPFELKVEPFYCRENQEHLAKAIQNYNCGNTQPIHKTLAELEEMET